MALLGLILTGQNAASAPGFGFTLLLSDTGTGVFTNISARFTPPFIIPESARLVLTLNPSFSAPQTLTVNDVDFLINGVQQPVAETPSVLIHGVRLNRNVVEITLGEIVSIPINSALELYLGTHAVFQVTGQRRFLNPSQSGTYGASLTVFDPNGNPLGADGANMVVLPHVSMSATVPLHAGNTPTTLTPTPAITGGGGGAPAAKLSELLVGLPKTLIERFPSAWSAGIRFADLNTDRRVNAQDFTIISAIWTNANFGTPEGASLALIKSVDLNGDKQLSLKDISIVLSQWDQL